MSSSLSGAPQLLSKFKEMHSAGVYENVQLGVLADAGVDCYDVGGDGAALKQICNDARLEVKDNKTSITFVITSNAGTRLVRAATWNKSELEFSRVGQRSVVIQVPEDANRPVKKTDNGEEIIAEDASEQGSYFLRFARESDARCAHRALTAAREETRVDKSSVLERRTEASSAEQYFQFYSLLSQQQNMLQDYVRTSTYQRAILDNAVDFRDKVVMDVGAGSGILSFFAVQAGAKRVYAVEASATAQHCEALVKANDLSERIIVLNGKLEEIELDEPIDVLVSEPLGYMLFNERMLETFLHAKKFLRNDCKTNDSAFSPFAVGRMFPTRSELFIAPFTDDALYTEVLAKANFWYQQSFHGCVDLTALRDAALREYFRQPVVDTFDVRVCCAAPMKHTVDFATASETDLVRIDVPLRFVATQSATVHGLAFWFDVAFVGSAATVWLSTSPSEPLTHWYQVRCLVPTPIFVHAGQTITGRLLLSANARQSYDVDVELVATLSLHAHAPGRAADVHTIRSRNTLDLKNPLFRYTGVPVQPPPGTHTQQSAPSELFWQAQAQPGAQCDAVLNGNLSIPQPAAFQTVAAVPNNQQFVPANACDGLLNDSHSPYGATIQHYTV